MKIGPLNRTEENDSIIFSRQIDFLTLSDTKRKEIADSQQGGYQEIAHNGDKLWVSVPKEYSEYFCEDRIDGYVSAMLLTAMTLGEDIESDDPISETLLFQFEKYLIPALLHEGKELYPIRIKCPVIADITEPGKYVGGSFSCGVDSMSVIANHSGQERYPDYDVDLLCMFNSGYNGNGEIAKSCFHNDLPSFEKACSELGYNLLVIDSNIADFSFVSFLKNHTYLTCGLVLMMQRCFKTYFYASGLTLYNFTIDISDPAHYDIFLLQMLSTGNLRFYSGNAHLPRVDKVELISDRPNLIKYLHVCTARGGTSNNCGMCSKCIRTMLEADSVGKLDAFSEVFPIERFQKKKNSYIAYMLSRRKKDIFYQEIYNNYISRKRKIPFTVWLRAIYYRISST